MLGGINIKGENMNDFFSKDNILIQAGAEDGDSGSDKKKSKGSKGDGVNAVLVLMKELRDFQERIEDCLEAQDIQEIAAKIQGFDNHLDDMYAVLLEIASTGITSKRKDRAGVPPSSGETKTKNPIMMGVPQVPKIG
jgi:hypothetical protein